MPRTRAYFAISNVGLHTLTVAAVQYYLSPPYSAITKCVRIHTEHISTNKIYGTSIELPTIPTFKRDKMIEESSYIRSTHAVVDRGTAIYDQAFFGAIARADTFGYTVGHIDQCILGPIAGQDE